MDFLNRVAGHLHSLLMPHTVAVDSTSYEYWSLVVKEEFDWTIDRCKHGQITEQEAVGLLVKNYNTLLEKKHCIFFEE